LSAFKAANPIFDWKDDILADGRVVAVFSIDHATCTTRVQSQRAGVSTVVSYNRLPSPPLSEICDRAIAFTKATISRMPV